jgi:hypothetical protein
MQVLRNRKGITIRCSVSEYEVLCAMEQSVDNVVMHEPTKGHQITLNKIGKLLPEVRNLEETL